MSVALITVFDTVAPPLQIPVTPPYSVPRGTKTAVADTAANVIAAFGGAAAIAGVCSVVDAADSYASYIGRAVKDFPDSSFETGDIQDASISTAKLADVSVTTAKLAANAVTSAKLATALTVAQGFGAAAAAASAQVDINSTTKGALVPRMTTTQRDAISSPAEGLLVWNITTHALNCYSGSAWQAVTAV